jgi:hypothetical protein
MKAVAKAGLSRNDDIPCKCYRDGVLKQLSAVGEIIVSAIAELEKSTLAIRVS